MHPSCRRASEKAYWLSGRSPLVTRCVYIIFCLFAPWLMGSIASVTQLRSKTLFMGVAQLIGEDRGPPLFGRTPLASLGEAEASALLGVPKGRIGAALMGIALFPKGGLPALTTSRSFSLRPVHPWGPAHDRHNTSRRANLRILRLTNFYRKTARCSCDIATHLSRQLSAEVSRDIRQRAEGRAARPTLAGGRYTLDSSPSYAGPLSVGGHPF
jgi:hypothetical protein